MAALERRARRSSGITWLFEHRATRLLRSGGQVTGVLLQNARGEVEVTAHAVVVTTGGFNNNADMVAKQAAAQSAHAERILLGGGFGARGDGHRMLRDVGAQFTQLDAVWMFPYATPDYRKPESGRGLALRGLDGDIWINDEGTRFHDESLRGGATGAIALLNQTRGRAWSVVDSRIASGMTIADPRYRNGTSPVRERIDEFLRESPHVVSAPTLAELAAKMQVDGANLRSAVDELNTAISAGAAQDPAFGKPLAKLRPTEDAPFYAIRLHPMARKNLGGVRTDMHTRVLDTHGRPIPGLFAAGEVAGMAGGRINGRAALEGTSFGPSVFSGMVAGQAAVDVEHTS